MNEIFTIFFNTEDRMQAIRNATDCLMARLMELTEKSPQTVKEQIEINNEMIEISKQLRAYEDEAAKLLMIKIESLKRQAARISY